MQGICKWGLSGSTTVGKYGSKYSSKYDINRHLSLYIHERSVY